MDELNKKLCELLEIEPIITDYCKSGPIDCDGQCGNCEESTEIKLLPDFKKPENFVKLLSLLCKPINCGIELWSDAVDGQKYHFEIQNLDKSLYDDVWYPTIEEALIQASIILLTVDNYGDQVEYLQNQAQQTDWKY